MKRRVEYFVLPRILTIIALLEGVLQRQMRLSAEAERLTDLPVIVVNTHAHFDHVGDDHCHYFLILIPTEIHMPVEPGSGNHDHTN